jgi:hypothetical protein
MHANYSQIFAFVFRDSVKNAELEECFSERFIASDCEDDESHRQLEIHLSDGKFQRKFTQILMKNNLI